MWRYEYVGPCGRGRETWPRAGPAARFDRVPPASLDPTLEMPTRTYPDLPRRFVTNDSQSVEEI